MTRESWRAKVKERKAWGRILKLWRSPLVLPDGKLRRVRVAIQWQSFRPRAYDPLNDIASYKEIEDAFRRAGWMVDDSENWYEPDYQPQVITQRLDQQGTYAIWRILE